MADVHEPEVRSYNMSQIKGKNTKPEILVRRFLHRNGYRYSLHSKKLPGKPDIALKRYKTIILVNGCFWHGHQNCRYFALPKTRTEWWKEKIEKTQKKDSKNKEDLINLGWNVIEVWECQLKPARLEETLNWIIEKINS
ncbi:DNA mismatch endonuclease Vsr [Fulvivirga sp. 29W222]|uniref:Very short patch repair endonuclease n=1 Tax=Fulvivirga marina TaxID=2494733 RepID=A0A937FYD5_9BACT|nr:very short patch repair endonuclease [Fulvivirga marina]MBL6446736.1 DNA mismatch endonuclease Vsr [Fulvivirga marina]